MKAFVAFASVLIAFPAAAQVPGPRFIPGQSVLPARVRLQLEAVPVAELVTILYRDILKVPYVVAPEVSTDRRTVSIRLDSDAASAHAQVVSYLRALGLVVRVVGGVDQIGSRRSFSASAFDGGGFDPSQLAAPSASLDRPPLPASAAIGATIGGHVAPAPAEQPPEVVVYRPLYRDPAYLSEVLSAVFPGIRFGKPSSVEHTAANSAAGGSAEVLVLAGTKAEVAAARKLVRQLDVEVAQLAVKATVFEVQTGTSSQSAISVALNLISGKLLGGLATSTTPLDSYARIKTGNVDAVVSALASDNRFRVVTSPSVRTRSGAEAVLTSGSQVPVLGSVSFQGNTGVPVQSVEYRDSGVILKVRPVVHGGSIDVDVSQELSNFVRTDTGVNTSPTLIKRALSNKLSLRSGDVVVLGGLTEERSTSAKSGLFSGLWLGRSREKTRTEIVLVLQVVAEGDGTRDARSDSEDARAPLALGATAL